MDAAAELVGHVPVVRTIVVRHARAALHVAAVAAIPVADVRADRRAGHCTARGREILPGPAADLVAENAADHCTGDRTGHVRVTAEVLSLDPATLVGRADHRPHVGHARLEEALALPPMPIVA